MNLRKFIPAAACLVASVAGARASAQATSDVFAPTRPVESPEWFNLEFRGGPYEPNVGNDSFDDTFNDSGPLWAVELDGLILPIPYVGRAGVGASFGWAAYEGSAFAAGGSERAGEKTKLTLLPLSTHAVLYVDVLSRKLRVPFVFLGKLGLDTVFWSTSTGGSGDADGVSLGLRWAVQAALELDFFERSAARTLDEEYGINHSRLFVELYKSMAGSNNDDLPLGDTTLAFGLAFTF